MARLKPLKAGDLIAVAAPAAPFDRRRFLKAVGQLRVLGLRVVYRRDLFARRGYLAGDDRRRAGELGGWLANRRARALLFARGGYGTQRLLPFLKGLRLSPKVVVGCSDLTVLLNHLWTRYRLPSLYGPMVAPHLGNKRNARRLRQALTEPDFFKRQRLTARAALKGGRTRGRLVGGCLSLITSTIGTPFEPETRGSILFLEDTDEEPYAVDRLLTQLIQAGKLKRVRGIILGTFRLRGRLFPPEILKVFRDRLRGFRGPVLWGVRFGHCREPLILPLGGLGRIAGRRLVIEKGIF